MKTTIILIAVAVCFLGGAHGYANGNDNNSPVSEVKSSIVNNNGIPAVKTEMAHKVAEPKSVKNVWREMPAYDRFGNEITARARKNMRENSVNNVKEAK